MTFRKVELVVVACDLCQAAGPAAAIHEYAEQDAAKVGITRFLNGSHACKECRDMMKDAVKPAVDEKPVKVAKVKAVGLLSARVGHFMQTVSGKAFWPLDPRADEVDIEDIAHALSMMCRFGGHILDFYSVAEHSVRVSEAIAEVGGTIEEQFFGLLHDAAEAYIGDMVWPLKQAPEVRGYKDVEKRVEAAIAERFGLAPEMPAIVKHFDIVMLATEKRDIASQHVGGTGRQASAAKMATGAWHCDVVEPLEWRIEPWCSEVARNHFMGRYRDLDVLRSK